MEEEKEGEREEGGKRAAGKPLDAGRREGKRAAGKPLDAGRREEGGREGKRAAGKPLPARRKEKERRKGRREEKGQRENRCPQERGRKEGGRLGGGARKIRPISHQMGRSC